jgi:hypothetical protein
MASINLSYDSVLQDLRDSILTKQRQVDANREKCNSDFLTRVKCSREIMSKIDAMYDRAKSAFELEITTLDISFGDVRRSRDEYVQSVKDEKTLSLEKIADITETLKDLGKMPMLTTLAAVATTIKSDVNVLLDETKARCAYLEEVLLDLDRGKKGKKAQIGNDLFSVPLPFIDDNLVGVAVTSPAEVKPSQILKDLVVPLQYNHRFILDSFQNTHEGPLFGAAS